jgi:hypothetical protein
MLPEPHLAVDVQALRPGLDPVELDGLLAAHQLHAFQRRQEVEVPPGAAELAVGHGLQPGLFLPRDHVADAAVLHLLQVGGADPLLGELRASLLQCGWTQQAPHFIGTEWRMAGHGGTPLFLLRLALGDWRSAIGCARRLCGYRHDGARL